MLRLGMLLVLAALLAGCSAPLRAGVDGDLCGPRPGSLELAVRVVEGPDMQKDSYARPQDGSVTVAWEEASGAGAGRRSADLTESGCARVPLDGVPEGELEVSAEVPGAGTCAWLGALRLEHGGVSLQRDLVVNERTC